MTSERHDPRRTQFTPAAVGVLQGLKVEPQLAGEGSEGISCSEQRRDEATDLLTDSWRTVRVSSIAFMQHTRRLAGSAQPAL